jgi:hypothetical protein
MEVLFRKVFPVGAARLLDRCAEGGASGIPDDHRTRQGDRVRGYLRLLKGKAESAPPAPHDGPGLDITGLERDDLSYHKNKERIDVLALSFRNTAQALP